MISSSWSSSLCSLAGAKAAAGPGPLNPKPQPNTPGSQHPLEAHKNKLSLGLPVGKTDSVQPTVAGLRSDRTPSCSRNRVKQLDGDLRLSQARRAEPLLGRMDGARRRQACLLQRFSAWLLPRNDRLGARLTAAPSPRTMERG